MNPEETEKTSETANVNDLSFAERFLTSLRNNYGSLNQKETTQALNWLWSYGHNYQRPENAARAFADRDVFSL
jgi:hypothetical protein